MPWNIETDEDESFWMITPARGSSFLDFGTIKVPKYADVRDVMNYIIQCANLMPAAVELLKSADEKLLDLCCTCVNAMSEAGYSVDCKNCNVESLDTNIKELLAKLEGGAEE